jgi:hypothetical protein
MGISSEATNEERSTKVVIWVRSPPSLDVTTGEAEAQGAMTQTRTASREGEERMTNDEGRMTNDDVRRTKDERPKLKAVIHSTIGGVLRLRSAVPLKGKGLRKAKGRCPNALLMGADIPSLRPSTFNPQPSSPVYEYDVKTKAGHNYVFSSN